MKRKPKTIETPHSMVHRCWDSAHPTTKKKNGWDKNKKLRFVSRGEQLKQRAFEELQKPAHKRQDITQ
jgi:hypothetical protein